MMDDDSPIESERGARNGLTGLNGLSNGKVRPKQPVAISQQPPPRFENITRQLTNNSVRTEYRAQNKSPINIFRETQPTLKDAINVLMRPFEVILHNQLCMIQSQMVITLSGIRQVLKLGDGWINLSWLHSIKKIDKNKVLVLFYHMSPLVDGRKPSMESQLLEFTDREAA